MLKKYYQIVVENEANVDKYIKLAANYNLQCLYKIGIYGKEKQHELHVFGRRLNYIKFLNEFNKIERVEKTTSGS